MKERVVFEANVPVTATLAYADGLKVQGRFGDQVMYSLTDGRVMYVPPMVRDKLVELGVRQNEPFAICRAERREGNRRFVEWIVQADGSAAPAQSTPAHSDTPGSPVNGDSGARGKANGNGNGNGNGKLASASPSSGIAEAALRAALTASIDAALAAEQYASAHGLSIRFGSEDLRAMALSLFIQHARDGGVR
ncbi:MAG TPA: hypothetical protein VFC15_14430 [Candidatus Limnocylindrales bacterium]|jgi:hypothetical protein|nr:hypothetical protein [Candidatus Limnocylindrales bacterium]